MTKLRPLFLLLCLYLTTPSIALPDSRERPEAFLPEGWEIQAQARGDLNGDGREDIAIIGRGTDPKLWVDSGHFMVGTVMTDPETGQPRSVMNTNPRSVMVLLATESGYRLIANNSNLPPVPSYPNGDALDGLSIVDGTLSLGLEYADRRHGELYSRVKFHFSLLDDRLLLVRGSRLQLRRYASNLEETREYDFLESNIKSIKFRYSDRELLLEETKAVAPAQPWEFSQVRPDAPMESWEPQP